MNSKYHWKVLESHELLRTATFRLKADKCEMPNGQETPPYYIFETESWVNTVPITREGEMVLIRQYRHAVGDIQIEIPGGRVDEYKGEKPKEAALRELREETGFTTTHLEFLGKHRPNPALFNNWMYSYIAFSCEKKFELELDPCEDIEVITEPISKVLELVKQGEIAHSIILATLFKALPAMGYSI